jgi:hypothetical protein
MFSETREKVVEAKKRWWWLSLEELSEGVRKVLERSFHFIFLYLGCGEEQKGSTRGAPEKNKGSKHR